MFDPLLLKLSILLQLLENKPAQVIPVVFSDLFLPHPLPFLVHLGLYIQMPHRKGLLSLSNILGEDFIQVLHIVSVFLVLLEQPEEIFLVFQLELGLNIEYEVFVHLE